MKRSNLFSLAFLIIAITAFCVSCNTKQPPAKTDNSITINQEIQSHKGYPILVGEIDRIGLESGTYYDWFSESYNNYLPDQPVLDTIGAALKDLDIEIFMGTWCEDSQREVPRFYKILDVVSYDEKNLKVVSLDHHPDRHKQSPNHEEEGKKIELVPTFIFYKNGAELGRIIESPEASLEKDIEAIVQKVQGD